MFFSIEPGTGAGTFQNDIIGSFFFFEGKLGKTDLIRLVIIYYEIVFLGMLKNRWRKLFIVVIGLMLAFALESMQGQNYIQTYNHNYDYITGIVMTFLVWEGNLLIDTYMNRKFPWTGSAVKRIFIQFPTSLLYSAIATYFLMSLYDLLLTGVIPAHDDPVAITATLMGILATIILLSIELGIQFFKNWKISLLEVQLQKELTLQAQLQSLRTQVNPHFLFNNLSVLSGLVLDNQDKALDFIKQLGKVYHYLLEVRTSELVELEHELQFIYAYNYLLQIRFGKALSIEVKKDDLCKNKMLPPMALQMVIENCTKHNIATLAQPLHISITCLEDKILVSNNIQVRPEQAEKSGTGLENIKERYGFLSGRIPIINNDHKHFVVELPLLSAV